jgi:hypothetical protein
VVPVRGAAAASADAALAHLLLRCVRAALAAAEEMTTARVEGYARTTFRIVTCIDAIGILCLRCGRTSFNPHDVAHFYCGGCHAFHLEPLPGSRVAVEADDDGSS